MTAQSAAVPALRHRAVAELVGTAFLVAAVVGPESLRSGVTWQCRAAAARECDRYWRRTHGADRRLAAHILGIQPRGYGPRTLYRGHHRTPSLMIVGAQITGAMIGVVVANLMFGEPPVSLSTTQRADPGIWLAEVVATAGLVLLITALSRAGLPQLIGWAVGSFITAGYWFTSSTSFVNPAVTLARMFSDTFAGIQPASVPMFLVAQAAGGAVGWPRPGHLPAAAHCHRHHRGESN